MSKKSRKKSPDCVLRKRRDHNFKTIGCDGLDNRMLSYRAKGVLWYLLSRGDEWKFFRDQLVNMSREGRDAVTTALGELKIAGHLKIDPIYDGKRFNGHQWTISEIPVPEWITEALKNRTTEQQKDGKSGVRKNRSSEKPSATTIEDKLPHSSTTKLQDSSSVPPLRRDTWLTPFIEAWSPIGIASASELAGLLGKLKKIGESEEEMLRRFKIYVAEFTSGRDNPQFASVAAFVKKYRTIGAKPHLAGIAKPGQKVHGRRE